MEIASIACFKLGPSWAIIEFLHDDKPEADNDKVEVVEDKRITMSFLHGKSELLSKKVTKK